EEELAGLPSSMDVFFSNCLDNSACLISSSSLAVLAAGAISLVLAVSVSVSVSVSATGVIGPSVFTSEESVLSTAAPAFLTFPTATEDEDSDTDASGLRFFNFRSLLLMSSSIFLEIRRRAISLPGVCPVSVTILSSGNFPSASGFSRSQTTIWHKETRLICLMNLPFLPMTLPTNSSGMYSSCLLGWALPNRISGCNVRRIFSES
ncbi:hypothetical protein WICPIJ_005789, partial [Wickerhamomyces pijperi]